MTTSVVAVRSGAKDLTQLGEEQRMGTGKKSGRSAPVGRELTSKERERTERTQQVPPEGNVDHHVDDQNALATSARIPASGC